MNPFQSVWAIAINTFRETIRDRVLYACVVFAIFLTLAVLLLGSLSVSQNQRVLEDIGLFTISTIGGVIAIFAGTNLVYKELDKRTIYLIFTKPIGRWQFILGKFLGLSLCIVLVTAIMGAILMILTFVVSGEKTALLMPMIGSLGLICLELLLVIAMATFFSTFATPLMSVIFTLSLWLAGHMGQSLLTLSKMSTSQFVKPLFTGIYYLLPDLSKLTQLRFELMLPGFHMPSATLLLITDYILAYIMLLLGFATIVTSRREFN